MTAVQEEASKINPLAAQPPFSLADIRNAIPDHCWKRNPLTSFAYLARDLGVVAGLVAAVARLAPLAAALPGPQGLVASIALWTTYAIAQGTMFWALFVVGHDCGHQSFSNDKRLNDFVGHLVHSSILVPYHGWRVSHRAHHANHGHVENDESWVPFARSVYAGIDRATRLVRYVPLLSLLLYPVYLLRGSPGKEGNHLNPDDRLFTPSERPLVVMTNVHLALWAGVLAVATAKLGLAPMALLYWAPYVVFVAWLDFVTYMHHHGPEGTDGNGSDAERVPWYRGDEWTYMRGGLSTLDHDYGLLNHIHHDIGTHVVHHLFPQIPHYNLCEATEAVKPVLGPYYREPVKSGPLPFGRLWRTFSNAQRRDHFVDDSGDIVFYQTDPELISDPGKRTGLMTGAV
jgi:omega-3 fatty acid desaturase (delta-15 desaturase)